MFFFGTQCSCVNRKYSVPAVTWLITSWLVWSDSFPSTILGFWTLPFTSYELRQPAILQLCIKVSFCSQKRHILVSVVGWDRGVSVGWVISAAVSTMSTMWVLYPSHCLSVCLSAAVSLMSTTWVLCPCLYVCLSNCLSSVSLSLSVISLCVCATWVTDSYRPPTMSCFSAFRCIYLSLSVFGLFFCLSVCLSVSFSFWQSVSVNWINLCSKYWDSYGVVGFTLHVTHCRWFQGRLIIWVIWPNQQCHNSERPGHGQIDHAQLTKR